MSVQHSLNRYHPIALALAVFMVCGFTMADATNMPANARQRVVHTKRSVQPAAKSCAADAGISISASELPGFVVLKMGEGRQGWFNGNEVKAFYQPVKGITVPCAKTEITVHDTHYWVQQAPEEVAKKLAEALGVEKLAGFAVLKMGNGTNGWFNAGEVMAFYGAIQAITVKAAQTELTVHGDRVWLQETPEEVAEKLAEALGTEELEGFVVLKMGNGTKGWFNANEVMAFYQPVQGITVNAAHTEITVHDYNHWVQETPQQVAEKLAQVRAKTAKANP